MLPNYQTTIKRHNEGARRDAPTRWPWFILMFAAACALGCAYGCPPDAWPFGVVEAIRAGFALRRGRHKRRVNFKVPAVGETCPPVTVLV